MTEIIDPNSAEIMMESYRHEFLCEDIIKKIRASLPSYAIEIRKFVRESLASGFDRSIIRHSLAVFEVEIISLIRMAEDALVFTTSPKAKLLEGELQALKASFGVFIKTSESIILEEPAVGGQMFFDDDDRRIG